MRHVAEHYLDSDIIIVIRLLFTERRYILSIRNWHRRLPSYGIFQMSMEENVIVRCARKHFVTG